MHAKQRCVRQNKKDLRDYCTICEEEELEAAKAHCKRAKELVKDKNPKFDVEHCIKCSVALSCPGCNKNPPTCKCPDIGLEPSLGVSCNPRKS